MSAGTMFPIGHYCGTAPPDSRAAADQDHLVRVGSGLEGLTQDEFGIWMLAHGLADVGRGDWTTDDIIDRATDAGITTPAGCVDALSARGLLAFVPTHPDRADESVAFAAACRVAPLLAGLGTVPGRPDQHAIGIPGVGTAALLDPSCYELWRKSAVTPTLWQLCQERVARLARAGAVDDTLDGLVDPGRLLTDLLGELRVLVVHGCAYLDVVPAHREPGGEALAGTPTETGESCETGGTRTANGGNVAG